MDRRTSIKNLFGLQSTEIPSRKDAFSPTFNPVNSGLEPFSGNWTKTEASHLLRRTLFGPTIGQIQKAVEEGLNNTVDILLQSVNSLDPPVNFDFENDPNVPIGSSWIDMPYDSVTNYRPYRRHSFSAWLMKNIYEQETSVYEKMTLFWHNHFVTSEIHDPKFDYIYFTTIRSFALGNFREFVKAMTINPSMLRYLNGNQNKKNSPNENYARELLELFTIGKGEQSGPDDYTNYTEDDITAISRILTGWKDDGYRTEKFKIISSYFRSWAHDKNPKTLSHRFDGITIENGEENEYAQLIDLIFGKKEVARFISRKLYRWFVYHAIDENTEENVIEAMADLMIESDYEIEPVLRSLISSQHFFDFINNGCLIKNPLDFIFSTINSLEIDLPKSDLEAYYSSLYSVYNFSGQLQLIYGDPPSVAGWKAYYQQPSYYEIWINSVTLPSRMNFTKAMSLSGISIGGHEIKVDVFKLLEKIENPSEIDSFINQFVELLFPQDITKNQKNYLKDFLIPGLPDFEWTVEYFNYLNNQEDENIKISMENKLRLFISAMLTMPEYYLS